MLNKLVVAICSVTVITGCSVQPIRFATDELRETVRSDMDRLTRHQDRDQRRDFLDEAIARAVRNNRDRKLKVLEAALRRNNRPTLPAMTCCRA